MRFTLTAGKHYQKETRTIDGQEVTGEMEYQFNDPTRNVVVSDLDLEERFGEKFRRLPEVEQEVAAIPDDAFRKEAIRRGLIQADDSNPSVNSANERAGATAKTVQPPAPPASTKLPPHPALANLGKMPLVGLQQLAEDEEIDVSACKGDQQIRDVIRKALEARSK